jgi:type II secretory pathway pseudopilin PulG
MSLKIKNAKAFTLLELAVALLVFFVGILGLLQLIAITINSNQRNRDITLATSFAQQKIDELLRPELVWTGSQLTKGGKIPGAPNVNPINSLPQPVAGFADFFTYDGLPVTFATAPTPGSAITTTPNGAYFIRQWQICDGCSTTNSGAPDCSATAPTCSPSPVLKKIVVTVTALNPTLRNSLPSVTLSVYRSRLG